MGDGHAGARRLRVDPVELVDAAGAFDAVALALASNEVAILKPDLLASGSEDLDRGLEQFASKWWGGTSVLLDRQLRFARGIRESVADYLEVDADVAYAMRALSLGIEQA